MRSSILLLLSLVCLRGQDLKEFEKRVTEFTLANGLHFIVLERHEAPVVSFHTYVNAGSIDDPFGQTGLAHMFEHMAFKGTQIIGTKNWPAEKQALEAVEQAYDALEAEEARRELADPHKLKLLQERVNAAIEKADSYVIPNEFPRIIEINGGEGLNAATSEESTDYFYSLPSNRIELWFLLEAQRFLRPAFREFYKERDVVREERRMRVDSNPQGELMEVLQATAFAAHAYRKPTAGWASDIEHLRVEDARAFFETYYVPANITIGIAGDVNPGEARRLAERYFARLPKRPLPPPLHTVEPKQEGEKRVQVQTASEPLLVIGYKRPSQYDKDDPVFDVLSGILASGRTGILFRELVRDKKLALNAGAAADFPAAGYPSLFLLYALPNDGHTVQEVEAACDQVLERLKREKVDDETVQRVKTKVRAGLIRQLDSNSGLASQLVWFHVNYGNWRKLFTGLEDIERVTAADVQRVARQYLSPGARTVAYTVPLPGKPAGAAEEVTK